MLPKYVCHSLEGTLKLNQLRLNKPIGAYGSKGIRHLFFDTVVTYLVNFNVVGEVGLDTVFIHISWEIPFAIW